MSDPTPPIGHTERSLFVPLLTDRDDLKLRVFVVVWIVALGYFWSWWLQPAHWVSTWGMLFNSTLLAWATGLIGYMFAYTLRGTRPNPEVVAPADLRVAMVVTKAPSEPWDVVKRTLEAMLDQDTDRPYAVWLADEKPDRETLAWCVDHGVQISTRFGVAEYHQTGWPRRTKSKEGNLAYFYDHYGYDLYDVVAQFDADHVPARSYLEEILRPFASPKVGYVAAPSVCDSNLAAGWTVRARLYKEATLHGIVQAGCNDGFAPVCIGSHYAVRTQALRQIGGIGPELAEDFSTTFLLLSAGWEGAFAIDAEAHGEGPESTVDLLVQETQWARSLATVWTRYTSGRWSTVPRLAGWRLKFALVFYPLFGMQMLAGVFLPAVALAIGDPWVSVPLTDFWAHLLPAGIVANLGVWWLRRHKMLRPADAALFGWEVAVFTLARWPWLLGGYVQGTWAGLRKKDISFKVTPKGDTNAKTLPVRYVLPMLLFATINAAATVAFDGGEASGYKFLAAFSAVSYIAASITIVALHLRDNRRRRHLTGGPAMPWRRRGALGRTAALLTSVAAVAVVTCLSVGLSSV
jgi:cellulose synthase (UDP-forming)